MPVSTDTSTSAAVVQTDSAPNALIESGITNAEDNFSHGVRAGAEIKLSQRKKWGLLALFSLSLIIDQWCLAAFYILTSPISDSMSVPFAQQSWVITSYTVTFAATLLFWGRVSDLYSPAPVFSYGLVFLGALNLIISFLPERYSFFILRAFSGIAGSSSVPSSFRLIVAIFEPHELHRAFTIYGVSGALANCTGNLIAGAIMLIPSEGQGEPWRWFFRLLAAIVLPVGAGSVFWIPKRSGEDAGVQDKRARLDLFGCALMMTAIILLILSLTLGASNGWASPGFIAPFIISLILFPSFFLWESRLPTTHALLPPSIWRYRNFAIWIVFGLLGYTWWSVNFLAFIEYWMDVVGESPMIVSLRVLPQGVAPAAVAIVLSVWGGLMNWPRIAISGGCVLGVAAYVMFIFSHSHVGEDFWRYLFPSMTFGSAAMMVVFTATNVGTMVSVPSHVGGVAGATLQVSYQLGAAVSFAVQAGLFTVNDGGISNFDNISASLYFEMGFVALWMIMFLVLYRSENKVVKDGETGEDGR
ncbi:hypothetical protein I350_01643 [Cryptococcus amylolentus CBS 6273]|uniref:Major facilitator superfamily (MFS) profile domain-containing protein n=1 Tax=Cryptococcus amylolentus CBS 6273 TaxID=1296118 RepID=A0A1E3KD70_9TREE|nr:hypothetical protein I350_01643 [Cryptococcus amylolentus CBS 6273]